MICQVLLFAQLREAIGQDRLSIELRDGATVDEALDVLVSRHEPIAGIRSQLAVAVDEKYRPRSFTLSDGDVIALIPPVSGG